MSGQCTIRLSAQLGLVFALSAAAFLLLGTRDYLAVDGGLRAVVVHQRGEPFLNENNHLLYPVNVYGWTTALGYLGLRARDELEFLSLTQAMNAAAAAVTVTILYGLSYAATTRASVAAMVALGYGSSRAFLAHATNSAEPMVGLLWSAVSTALTTWGLVRRRAGPMFTGGAVLALAMATYQSMALVAVALVVLIWLWPRPERSRPAWRRMLAPAPFAAGFGFGIPVIYGTAYYLSGTRTLTEMIHRFLDVPGAHIYAGLSIIKAASVLPGFAFALFPCLPRECSGFRCLTLEEHRSWIPAAGLAVAITGAWLVAALALTRTVWAAATPVTRSIIAACGVGLVSTIAPPLLYLPTYDKLWLQPLSCWFLVVGVLMNTASECVLPRARSRGVLLGCSAAAMVAVAAWNLPVVASRYGQPTPHLTAARDVAAAVEPQDLLVGDWNEIFLLYQYLWAPRANSFNVPTEAERNGAAVVERLQTAILRTRAASGRVYFLGLLDLSPSEWRPLLAETRGVPYESLETYRRCAVVVRTYPYQHGEIALRLLGDCP